MPLRTQPASFIGLAVLSILAILVAPICAPLCAAGACASGATQRQCHEMANMIASGSEQFAAANKACESSDFSVVLVKSDETFFSLYSVQSYSTVALFGPSVEKPLGGSATAATDLSVHRVPPELGESLLLTTILRI